MQGNQTSVFGIQSSHGMRDCHSYRESVLCFLQLLKWVLSTEMGTLSVLQLFSMLYHIHLVLHGLRVLVLKSWPVEVPAEVHSLTACSDFSLGGGGRTQGSGSQRSDPKSQAGLTCSLSEVAVLLFGADSVFPVLNWAPRRTSKKERLLVWREERAERK